MALGKSFALESPPAPKKRKKEKKRHEFPNEIFCQTGTLISDFFLLTCSKRELISLWQDFSALVLLTFGNHIILCGRGRSYTLKGV